MSRLVSLVVLLALPLGLVRAEEKSRVYEMRTYTAAKGKLDALHARFRDHTTKLFEKHGMTNVGYFVPMKNDKNVLIYFLSYPSKEARGKSWRGFINDADWTKVFKESRKDGPLVTKVESVFLRPTDYSPDPTKLTKGKGVYELRHYTTPEGRLENLNTRFRDHTVKLFDKHGMTNVVYFNLIEGQPGHETTLVYLLRHKSREAARASFGAFVKDDAWKKARKESEEKAGGSLTVKGGVKSTFMNATDYSPLK